MINSMHMLQALAEIEDMGTLAQAAEELDIDLVSLVSQANVKARETLGEMEHLQRVGMLMELTDQEHQLAAFSSESAMGFLWGVRAAQLANEG